MRQLGPGFDRREGAGYSGPRGPLGSRDRGFPLPWSGHGHLGRGLAMAGKGESLLMVTLCGGMVLLRMTDITMKTCRFLSGKWGLKCWILEEVMLLRATDQFGPAKRRVSQKKEINWGGDH